MKNNIILLMPDYSSKYGSGSIIARRTVDLLKTKVDKLTVISCGDIGAYDKENVRVLTVPMGINLRIALTLARFGMMEDYLSIWVKNTLKYIKGKEKETIGFVLNNNVSVIAICVGYLGAFKLGLELKNKYGCELTLHFHDPIKYAVVNGEKYSNLPYASRENYERKYVQATDKIATCSNSFKEYLIEKYPEIDDKTRNFYFGWIEEANVSYKDREVDGKEIVITYGGVFSDVQGPEIIGEALKNIEGFTVCYVGNWENYKPVRNLEGSNIVKLPRMDHQSYMQFLIEKSDIGFLSLSRSYFSACVPAKLYEYINTGKPIIAALKESDASRIIRDNGYGIAVEYSKEALVEAVKKMTTIDLQTMRSNLLRDRESWNFDKTMEAFSEWVIE